MTEQPGVGGALRPLWWISTGAGAGAALTLVIGAPDSTIAGWALILLGATCLIAGLVRHPRRASLVLLLLAGALTMLGRGLTVRAGEATAEDLPEATAFRVRARIMSGWQDSRWGSQATARIVASRRAGEPVRLPRLVRIEVRGHTSRWQLPSPGTTVEGLVAARPTASGVLLVASSAAVLRTVAPPHGIAAWRDWLASRVMAAAGTDVDRIRAAELVAAVALGRRDLLPRERREAWRRSGLAHVLAVSGLHVGLVGAMVWFGAIVVGLRPGPTRALTAAGIVAYAALAGASPSALRAAAMGVVILAAHSLGRAVLPLAAVLVAALAVLLTNPGLVADPGFQLTVVITAALVRWVPPLVENLPLPRWAAAVLAVPVVAQLAAAPIVMWHFRTAAIGAVVTNLCVPLLVTPTLVAALAATLLAPLWTAGAAVLLDLVALADSLLWTCGAASRATVTVTPAVPAAIAAALVIAGGVGLRYGRRARLGVAAWLVATGAIVVAWPWASRPDGSGIELLTVPDGLGAIVWTPTTSLLFDGGSSPLEAVRQLRDRGWSEIDTVVASHTDEDHVGGLAAVLESLHPAELVLPAWMVGAPAAAPLIRSARRAGVRLRPMARGSATNLDNGRLDVLWPPAESPPTSENERSLVARLELPAAAGTILLTADIGRDTERWLARRSRLACDVLLVPHHGSRYSSSPELLAAAAPAVALIPAAPFNRHGHPAAAVLERLRARDIPFRTPIFDGSCGARRTATGWQLFPSADQRRRQRSPRE